MAKLTLTDLTQLSSNETSAVNSINTNNTAIETALENTLSRDGTAPNTMTANIDLNSNKVINVADPTNNQDAVTKKYGDDNYGGAAATAAAASAAAALVSENNAATSETNAATSETNAGTSETNAAASAAAAQAAANGIKWKDSVLVASTANLTLSGEQTIDGVLTSASRILVKDQTAQEENGVYVTDAAGWTRATPSDTWAELISMAVAVEEGTVNADRVYISTNDDGGTLGTTAVTFSQLGGGDLKSVNNLSDVASAATSRTNLGLGTAAVGDIGVDVQAYDAELAAIAGLTSATNKVPYFTGSGSANLLDFLDEDTMSSDSATAIASQQSIKAYVDASSGGGITLGTPVATTSGTSIDFTSIPSGTKRITVNLSDVSTNGASVPIVQLGDSGGIETTSYVSRSGNTNSAPTAFTTGFALVPSWDATFSISGTLTLTLLDSSTNTWVGTHLLNDSIAGALRVGAGDKSLSAELDRIRLTTVGGTDTFDTGKVNITYE